MSPTMAYVGTPDIPVGMSALEYRRAVAAEMRATRRARMFPRLHETRNDPRTPEGFARMLREEMI